MWDDAVLKVSPLLAAVSTVLLIFISAVILLAEWFRRRSVRGEVQAAATRYDA
jgi:putative spermidine/putrescine transport system permease protein